MDDAKSKRVMPELCENATLSAVSTASVITATPSCLTYSNCSASAENSNSCITDLVSQNVTRNIDPACRALVK